MFRLFKRWFRKSKTINNEPINKVSLIVIILIDIFILTNVFMGLAEISSWHISPTQAYPCYSQWQGYQEQTTGEKNFEIISRSLDNQWKYNPSDRQSLKQIYIDDVRGNLGKVFPTCLTYSDYQDQVNNPENLGILKNITQDQLSVDNLNNANASIRAQYDSTLLEKIADQPQNQSINQVSADKAKQQLEQNNRKIAIAESKIATAKQAIIVKPEAMRFISFLQDQPQFQEVKSGYQQASFWYPTIQFSFQAGFLLPLIFIALLVHQFAQNKHYGLIALISWHLLVIFLIPLLLKILEFLQIGIIFRFLRDFLSILFGGLFFLINYLYIFVVPVVGFAVIKFFQRFVFNPKAQAAKQLQNSCCTRCGKKIRNHDIYCPHCGYHQYIECHNCHTPTYKNLSFCNHCGHPQDEVSSAKD
ncbi:MAG: hypothetical protein AUK48_02075 [Oscillatoriales cyanobacterium CG2_30_44_21]|nr:MAG: hypothetical protein AUK48_02075 [Oscillatoriales cyanobacterium CG2_30_44_21]